MREDPSFAICIAGDAINDVYKMGSLHQARTSNRFVIEREFTRPGGAANVQNNIKRFTKGTDIEVVSLLHPSEERPSLVRFVENNTILFEYEERADLHPTDIAYSKVPHGRKGLVIADYNRGAVTELPDKFDAKVLEQRGQFEFVIIDSRYGRYNPYWLLKGNMRILHATDVEIENHMPELFNFTFHTNGPNPIRLLHWGEVIDIIDVPPCPVVDPTGAGDTFTAYIATYLATHPNEAWDRDVMVRACQEAISHCQEVVGRLGV